MAARMARKVARIQRAAVRTAVARIDADGTARLVFTTGTYTLKRSARSGAGHHAARRASAGRIGVGQVDAEGAGARRVRKLLADYVNDARASWSPGVEITPAWARRATGCSAGLSSKVAAALREQIAASHPAVTHDGREAA